MTALLRRYWPVIKACLAVVIVAVVGRRFYLDLRDHPELRQHLLDPGTLAAAGLAYVLGLSFSAVCWYRLLQAVGQRPAFFQVLRAYFLGQLGKYVPGKAYSLVLRADLARRPGVRPGLAGLTAFYEVFLTMASGAIVGAIGFAATLPPPAAPPDWSRLVALVRGEAVPDAPLDRTLAVAFALCLAAPLLLVTFPPVFNRLAHRASLPFRNRAEPLPLIHFGPWLEGLVVTSFCWFCLGQSLALVLERLFDAPAAEVASHRGLLTATMSVVYVAAFLVLVVPGALGVREYFLMVFLVAAPELLPEAAREGPRQHAVLVAAALRLAWTGAELLMAGLVWLLPRPPKEETAP